MERTVKLRTLALLAVLALLVTALGLPVLQGQTFHSLKSSTEPIGEAAAVTPSNTTDLPNECRALYIGSNGSVRLDAGVSGTDILFAQVKGGSTIPVRVKRVRATGTTANNLVCLY